MIERSTPRDTRVSIAPSNTHTRRVVKRGRSFVILQRRAGQWKWLMSTGGTINGWKATPMAWCHELPRAVVFSTTGVIHAPVRGRHYILSITQARRAAARLNRGEPPFEGAKA